METFKPYSECEVEELMRDSKNSFPLKISSKDQRIRWFELDYAFDEIAPTGAKYSVFYLQDRPETLVGAAGIDIARYFDGFNRLRVPFSDLVFDTQNKVIRLKADVAPLLRH